MAIDKNRNLLKETSSGFIDGGSGRGQTLAEVIEDREKQSAQNKQNTSNTSSASNNSGSFLNNWASSVGGQSDTLAGQAGQAIGNTLKNAWGAITGGNKNNSSNKPFTESGFVNSLGGENKPSTGTGGSQTTVKPSISPSVNPSIQPSIGSGNAGSTTKPTTPTTTPNRNPGVITQTGGNATGVMKDNTTNSGLVNSRPSGTNSPNNNPYSEPNKDITMKDNAGNATTKQELDHNNTLHSDIKNNTLSDSIQETTGKELESLKTNDAEKPNNQISAGTSSGSISSGSAGSGGDKMADYRSAYNDYKNQLEMNKVNAQNDIAKANRVASQYLNNYLRQQGVQGSGVGASAMAGLGANYATQMADLNQNINDSLNEYKQAYNDQLLSDNSLENLRNMSNADAEKYINSLSNDEGVNANTINQLWANQNTFAKEKQAEFDSERANWMGTLDQVINSSTISAEDKAEYQKILGLFKNAKTPEELKAAQKSFEDYYYKAYGVSNPSVTTPTTGTANATTNATTGATSATNGSFAGQASKVIRENIWDSFKNLFKKKN
jgi:hypothetical protein